MINITNLGANLSAKELIQSIFSSPLIGATCSLASEELCLKNNLTFVQLIQPFSKISTEGKIRNHLVTLDINFIIFQLTFAIAMQEAPFRFVVFVLTFVMSIFDHLRHFWLGKCSTNPYRVTRRAMRSQKRSNFQTNPLSASPLPIPGSRSGERFSFPYNFHRIMNLRVICSHA